MSIQIPSTLNIRAHLEPMSHAELSELAKNSGVPFHTLLKIRSGETKNPGIETVRKFYTFPHSIKEQATALTHQAKAATQSVAQGV